MQPWRWIPPVAAPAATQMAIDRWMAAQVLAGGPPLLRLYRCSAPALSLGRHQQRWPEHWRKLQAEGELDLVRRPSGGRAVLHVGDLTYALALRPQQRDRDAAYRQCCLWLQQAFENAGEPLQFGQANGVTAAQHNSCFASATRADLVTASGAKRIGSAQLWHGPALLQHGSVLMDPPAPLWQCVFNAEPPRLASLGVGFDQLERELRWSAEQYLCGGGLLDEPLTPAEWAGVLTLEPLGLV